MPEKLNGRENSTQGIVHNSMEEISSEVYTSMADINIISQQVLCCWWDWSGSGFL